MMRTANLRSISLSATLFFAFACGTRHPTEQPADLVLVASRVVTVDPDRPSAEVVATRDGRIVFVGDRQEVEPWIGGRTRLVEVPGGMILPGFQDAHIHPVTGGLELGECALGEADSEQQLLALIDRCARDDPGAEWLRGGGFQLTLFAAGNPQASMLDRIVPERPVYLASSDGHTAWVNSKALALAGISADTPDPVGGRIERDPATHRPTGALREDARHLVEDLLPSYSLDQRVAGLRRVLAMAASFGITVLHEADATVEDVAAYAELERRGGLTSRVVISLQVDPGAGVSQVEDLMTLRRRYRGERFSICGAKLFVDGVIESRTGALLEPYIGFGSDTGELLYEPAELDVMVEALDREGFQVHAHAIGDRAIRLTLDALAKARKANGTRDARHQLAHVQLWHPSDIDRLADLGVVANFQPLWAYADPFIVDLTEPMLGPERSRWLYPIGSVIASGARVAFGSDWSVTTMNPLPAIEVGMTRQDPDDARSPIWIPEERVSLESMLYGYTQGAAWVNFLDRDTGSITVGKLADLVVLDRDLLAIAPQEISEARVLLTLLEGEPVFVAPALQAQVD